MIANYLLARDETPATRSARASNVVARSCAALRAVANDFHYASDREARRLIARTRAPEVDDGRRHQLHVSSEWLQVIPVASFKSCFVFCYRYFLKISFRSDSVPTRERTQTARSSTTLVRRNNPCYHTLHSNLYLKQMFVFFNFLRKRQTNKGIAIRPRRPSPGNQPEGREILPFFTCASDYFALA